MNPNTVRSLAKHGFLTPEHIDKLVLHHPDHEYGEAAITSNSATPQNIDNALKSTDPETQIAAIKNKNISTERLNKFYHEDKHPSVQRQVLMHPLLSKENIDAEVHKPLTKTMNQIWHRKDLSDEHILHGINNQNSSLEGIHLSGIFDNHPHHMDSLFHKDASDRMKTIAVQQWKATTDQLGNAYFDKSMPLPAKAHLMRHRNTPRAVIEHGMKHPNEVVSTFAKKAAKDRGFIQ